MITTIIPVAPGSESKTRLAPILDASQRADLARSMLVRTIGVARALGPVVVVSRSPRMLDLARTHDAEPVREPTDRSRHDGLTPLNAAVMKGLDRVAEDATALVLPSDLPVVTEDDLRALVAAAGTRRRVVVLVPCQRGEGTNALLVRPPGQLVPHFGPDSFSAHATAAGAAGLAVVVHRAPALSDLDTPGDHARLVTTRAGTPGPPHGVLRGPGPDPATASA